MLITVSTCLYVCPPGIDLTQQLFFKTKIKEYEGICLNSAQLSVLSVPRAHQQNHVDCSRERKSEEKREEKLVFFYSFNNKIPYSCRHTNRFTAEQLALCQNLLICCLLKCYHRVRKFDLVIVLHERR